MRSKFGFVLVLLVLLISSCTPTRRGPQGPEPPQTTVQVQNQNWLDMNVYVLRGSQRVRLGTVTGASTRVFTIPSNLVFGATSLRFLADPVGSSRTPISQEITITPGDQVTLTIPN